MGMALQEALFAPLADNHDIISVKVYEVDTTPSPPPEGGTLGMV